MKKIFAPLALLFLPLYACAQQDYQELKPNVVFENDELVVQFFTMEPGTESGPHTHPGRQMEILTSDGIGTLYEADGRKIVLDMKKGDIRWIDPLPEAHNFVNTGEEPISWYLITLK